MRDAESIVIAVVTITFVILLLIIITGMLMVVNTNRRRSYQAKLAELALEREKELVKVEREATKQAMTDIARDLHDNVGQLLSGAEKGLQMAMDEAGPTARLTTSQELLLLGIEEVRRLGKDLNSDLWQQRSLTDALHTEASRLERVSRLRAHVFVNAEPPTLSSESNTILFRVFQEILNNALKHSGAAAITITLESTPDFTLTITDNGRGFDPAITKGNGGFTNIHKRCALIGFQAQCTSSPGAGCSWELRQV